MATGDKLVTLDGLKAAYDKAKGFVAPDFAQATANAAGEHVIYNGSLYLLPEGHTANTTWANTTKQQVPGGVSGEVAGLKSAIKQQMVAPEVTVISDYYIRGDNGVASPSEDYMCTDFVDISNAYAGSAIMFYGTFYLYVGAAFYNAGKQYVSGVYGEEGVASSTKILFTKIPENAKYLRVTLVKTKYTDSSSFAIMYQNNFDIKHTNAAVATHTSQIQSLEIGNGVLNGYQYNLVFEQGAIGGTGAAYDSTTDIRTGFIGVKPSIYNVAINLSGAHAYVVCYDANKTYKTNKGWNKTTDFSFEIPPDTDIKYVRIMVNYGNSTPISPVNNAVILSIDGLYKNIDYIVKNTPIIPSYFLADNYLSNKIHTVLNNCIMGSGSSFVFITDLHLTDNTGSSKNLVRYCIDNAPIPHIFTGGDIPPAYSTTAGNEKAETLKSAQDWLTWVDYWGQDRVYQLRGNHDYVLVARNNGSTNYYNMQNAGVRQYVMSKFGAKVNASDKTSNYYYFDDDSQKIRYIVIDGHSISSAQPNVVVEWITPAKINWLIDVLNDSDDYHIIILSHEACDPELPYRSSTLEIVQTLAEAYVGRSTVSQVASGALITADFTNATGELVCILSGHAHSDASHVSNGVLGIVTTCDALYGTGRIAGTVNENAFDIFSIDTTNKTIKAVRIGAGNDRSWYYADVDTHSVGDQVVS